MPGVLESPEIVSRVSQHTLEEGLRDQPSYAKAPARSRLAAFFQALCLSSRQETRSRYSQPAELQSANMLARDYPYVYIRLMCS